VALDPVLVTAREVACQIAFALGRVDEAERQAAALQRAAVSQPQEIALTALAHTRLAHGDTAAARALVRQAIATANPDTPTKHQAVYIAGALAALGDTTGAVRWLAALRPRETCTSSCTSSAIHGCAGHTPIGARGFSRRTRNELGDSRSGPIT